MTDAVIALPRNKARHRALFDVRPERLHVIYNGIDLEEYKRVDSRAVALRDQSSRTLCSLSGGLHGKGDYPSVNAIS
jgi:hypothetical protein